MMPADVIFLERAKARHIGYGGIDRHSMYLEQFIFLARAKNNKLKHNTTCMQCQEPTKALKPWDFPIDCDHATQKH